MLSRNHRLTASKDIMKVLRTGKRTSTGPFVIYALPARQEEVRMTVVISKKVDKRAAVRNRCRRRVREGFRPLVSDLKPSFDILVYIKQDMGSVEFEKVTQDLVVGCRRLGLFR